MAEAKKHRNRILDFARIFFASLVLLSHAPELTDGNRSREILTRFTRGSMTFGETAVNGFFLVSGYLILKSWQNEPKFFPYLQKRLLRIVPGYVVAVTLSLLFVGLLAPATPHFFRECLQPPTRSQLAFNLISLNRPLTPAVFPGLAVPSVNRSLWTLPYELKCYLTVAAFGIFGLFRWKHSWLTATVLLLLTFAFPISLVPHALFHLYQALESHDALIRLFSAFFVGGCFLRYRTHIPFQPPLAALAAALLCAAFATGILPELTLNLCGGYLLFYLGSIHLPDYRWVRATPDVSYGMYVYGWPIQEFLIWYLHPSPWVTFLLSLLAAALCGALSWHFVERPMLRFKWGASVALPPP